MRKSTAAGLLAVLSILSVQVKAEETPVFELSIKDHRFEPATIEIPGQQKIKLLVKNLDATPEEFESYELNREKIIPGNSQAVIFIGPLKAGEYPFFGDFNQATAQGKVIAK
jgi:hypothetical protein